MELRIEVRQLFGSRLKELRQRRRLSQERLGDLSGLSRNYVSDVENGHRSPGIENLIRLAHGLDVAAPELLSPFDLAAVRRLPV